METSFSALLQRLRDGHESAADEVFRAYAERLKRLIREKFDECNAGFGASDVVLEAMASFFRGMKERRGGSAELRDAKDLWQWLAAITKKKLYSRLRAERAAKRGGGRVGSLDDEGLDHLTGREPKSEDVCTAKELLASVRETLKEPERTIFDMRLAEYTNQEIAEKVDLTEESVSRKWGRIKEGLYELLEGE